MRAMKKAVKLNVLSLYFTQYSTITSSAHKCHNSQEQVSGVSFLFETFNRKNIKEEFEKRQNF